MPDGYSALLVEMQGLKIVFHLSTLYHDNRITVDSDSDTHRFETLVAYVIYCPHLGEGVLVLGVPKGLEVKRY